MQLCFTWARMMAGQGTMIDDDVYVCMRVQAPVINLLCSPVTYQLVLWVRMECGVNMLVMCGRIGSQGLLETEQLSVLHVG